MKPTDVMFTKEAVLVAEAVNETLKKLRKKTKVGAGGLTETQWYMACAEALLRCLEHVKNNLPEQLIREHQA